MLNSHLVKRSNGQKVADFVAMVVGSWAFILTQSAIITFWVIANSTDLLPVPKWDPYPFIFLNLTLSFQAAYTAPIIMMSQNRSAERDRIAAEHDYRVNKIAEQENQVILSELAKIHEKLDKHKTIKHDLENIEEKIQNFKKMLEEE